MSELKPAFSPRFNERGYQTSIDWSLSRGEFARRLQHLFEQLKDKRAAIPLPVTAEIGPVTCLLASIDCKGCNGLCCVRGTRYITLSPEEADRLKIKAPRNESGNVPMPVPCKFLKNGQCSIYTERPAACRMYPVQVGGAGTDNSEDVILGLDSSCPQALHLALRVFLATYDLAHSAKSQL